GAVRVPAIKTPPKERGSRRRRGGCRHEKNHPLSRCARVRLLAAPLAPALRAGQCGSRPIQSAAVAPPFLRKGEDKPDHILIGPALWQASRAVRAVWTPAWSFFESAISSTVSQLLAHRPPTFAPRSYERRASASSAASFFSRISISARNCRMSGASGDSFSAWFTFASASSYLPAFSSACAPSR